MKHKKGIVVFTALFTVVVFFSIFLFIWFWGDDYPDFEGNTFREEVAIPGLKDGACPQGLATASHSLYNKDGEIEYVVDGDGNVTKQAKTQDYYLVSAYFKDKPSRIYVVGKQSGYLGYVSLKFDDKDYYGHVGGIATNGTWVWIGSGNKVFCFTRTDTKAYSNAVDEIIQRCFDNGELELTKYFLVNGNAAFVSYYKAATTSTERLYVGEFYRKGNYETAKNHHVKTPEGNMQRAFMYEFNVSSSTDYGLSIKTDVETISEQVPKVQKIFSIPDRIQGVARVSGNSEEGGDILILSQSYGLANSEIMLYNFGTVEDSVNRVAYTAIDEEGFEYPGVTYGEFVTKPYRDKTVYVYFVYGSAGSDKTDGKIPFYRSYSIPSMSEGLAVSANGRVNILFESSANKYKPFVRQPLDKIYSFIPTKR